MNVGLGIRESSASLFSLAIGLAFVPAYANAVALPVEAPQSSVPQHDDGEIVVTANKREQRLADVGLSVAVVDSSALKTRAINDLSALANVVPGFSAGYSGYSTPIYSLRGVGVNEPSLASGSSVAIYTDQVPFTLPAMTRGATLDLERVEVVKGPQGTLYGTNATGGAINYIASRPTDDFQAGIDGSYGRYNNVALEGFMSGPLTSTLKARVAARTERQFDGWQKSVTRPGDRLGDVRKYQGRAIVEWEPSDSARFTFNANGWIDKSDTQMPQAVQWVGQGGNGLPLGFPYVQNSPTLLPPLNQPDGRLAVLPNKPDYADWTPESYRANDWFWQTSMRGEFDLSDQVQLTSITSYSKVRIRQLNSGDGLGISLIPASYGKPVYNSKWRANSRAKAFTQELRLSAHVGPMNWVLGANYEHDSTYESQLLIAYDYPTIANLPNGGFGTSNVHGAQKIKAWAVFSNVEFNLTDQLSVTGGIRISGEKRSFIGCTADSGDGRAAAVFNYIYNLTGDDAIQPGGCWSKGPRIPELFVGTLKESNTPWNLGVNFKPNRDSLLYARVSKGYKSGSFPTIGATTNGSYLPVTQESVLAYEAGFKFAPSRWISVEGAGFYYDYRNKQQRGREYTGPVFGLAPKQVNVPKSRIVGAELSFVLRPVEGLTLGVSGSYLDSKIQNYTGYNIDGFFGDLSDGPLPFVPKYNANANFTYTTPVSNSLNLFVGGDVAYRSKTSSQIAASSLWDIDSYTLFNAQLGVSAPDNRWRAWAWGKNITNKLYWTNVLKASEMVTRYTGMGATYGVSFSYKFW